MNITPGPHLTFDEQAARDPQGSSAHPCWCWHAGNGGVTGVGVDQVQHPDEWRDGAQSAADVALDL